MDFALSDRSERIAFLGRRGLEIYEEDAEKIKGLVGPFILNALLGVSQFCFCE